MHWRQCIRDSVTETIIVLLSGRMKGEKCLGVFALESKATKLAVWQHTIVINPTREKEQRSIRLW